MDKNPTYKLQKKQISTPEHSGSADLKGSNAALGRAHRDNQWSKTRVKLTSPPEGLSKLPKIKVKAQVVSLWGAWEGWVTN